MIIQDIIANTTKMIQREAYTARVCEELYGMEFDADMMKFHRDMAIGKSCGGIEVLNFITEKNNDDIYDKAVEEATQDIFKAKKNIIKLLDLAGFNGEEYYKSHCKANNDNIYTDITSAEHNEKIFAEIMNDTGATYEEAYTMCELDCTLEEAQQSIAQGKTYERLLSQLLPGNVDYFRNKYKNMDVSEDFIQSEAKELTEEQAHMFVYQWEQYEEE